MLWWLPALVSSSSSSSPCLLGAQLQLVVYHVCSVRCAAQRLHHILLFCCSWCRTTLLTSPRPVKDYTASPYKMDDTLVPTVPAPPPLVPFTGVDRKPMSPSPAKPFGMQASPLKPSPFKERVDTATQAVVQKSLVRKGALFGAAKQPAAEGAAAMPPVPPPAPPAAAATAAAAAAGPAIPVPPRPVPQQAAAVLAAGGMRIPGPDEMDS